MTEKEIELHEKIAEMEGDVKAVISKFGTVTKSFGINLEDFQGQDKSSVMSKLPMLLNKITSKLITGGFEELQTELSSVQPIIEKYKHLADATTSSK